MKKYEVANIHCENCAKTIKNALEDDFGKIEIDLSREPRVLSIDFADDALAGRFGQELSDLGFDIIREI